MRGMETEDADKAWSECKDKAGNTFPKVRRSGVEKLKVPKVEMSEDVKKKAFIRETPGKKRRTDGGGAGLMAGSSNMLRQPLRRALQFKDEDLESEEDADDNETNEEDADGNESSEEEEASSSQEEVERRDVAAVLQQMQRVAEELQQELEMEQRLARILAVQ